MMTEQARLKDIGARFLADTLESLVDSATLGTVIETLARIASEKADHIQASYATSRAIDPDALAWTMAARALSDAATRKAIVQVSK